MYYANRWRSGSLPLPQTFIHKEYTAMIEKVVMGTKVPAKMWLSEVEDSCLEQIITLASLPYAYKHIAVMPDAHTGKGMPIGGVLATRGVVIPNAVGVDIGCGMCALRTSLTTEDLPQERLSALVTYARERIPLGFDSREVPLDESLLPDRELDDLPCLRSKKQALLRQIGTLGGGNHFIEIQRDTATDEIWVMIHSGSRNVGLKVAEHYNHLAEQWCDRWYADRQPDLAFLPIETQEGKDYMREMEYCKDFAFANRREMMEVVKEGLRSLCPGVDFDPLINVPHNYAAWEKHFGEYVIVHRKGATRAYEGEVGIIPGSMGAHSYIVRGLGCPDSFMSCSHGAGRRLSRRAAFRQLSLEEQQAQMDELGVLYDLTEKGLDEAPGAYKDIEEVIAKQQDLVQPLVRLAPLAVIKG